MLSIDDFELYVFSYGFFSLNTTFVVVRLCIAAELALALLLALGWWRKWVWMLTVGLLLFFSLFLCYALLAGRNESCQCFGKWLDMSPAVSLVKNALLIGVALAYAALSVPVIVGERPRRVRVWVTALLLLVVVVLPFVVSVPDNWAFGPERMRYDQEAFSQAISDEGPLVGAGLNEGSQLVVFVTPGCPYCRMSREKIGSIVRRHGLDSSRVHYYEPADLPEGLFMQITHGNRPLIILLSEGRPVATYHYRNISERQLAERLRP